MNPSPAVSPPGADAAGHPAFYCRTAANWSIPDRSSAGKGSHSRQGPAAPSTPASTENDLVLVSYSKSNINEFTKSCRPKNQHKPQEQIVNQCPQGKWPHSVDLQRMLPVPLPPFHSEHKRDRCQRRPKTHSLAYGKPCE